MTLCYIHILNILGVKDDMANKTKREYGTGSISQRKDGKWQGRVNLGRDINGKRKQKYFYGDTEKEVKKKLKDYFLSGEKYNANNVAKMTLEAFLVDWLENLLVNTLKPKSYAIKEYIIKQQIVPRIGLLQVNSIVANDIQQMINNMVHENLSYSTIKKAFDTLNQRFKLAITQEQVNKNPTLGVILPKQINKKNSEIQYFSEEQCKELIKESRRTQGCKKLNVYRLGELVPFLIFTGLRVGEAIALEWKDIDDKNNTITINKNVIEVKSQETGKYILEKQDSTKTDSSTRIIPMSNGTKECIKNLKKINGDKKFVFASQTGKYISPSNFNRMFRGIQKALKYEIVLGVHSLRHTFATLMLNKGVDVKIVSELLGHSNVSVTYNIYIHTIQSQKIKAINMIDIL